MPSQRQIVAGLTSSTLVVLPEENEQEYNEVLRGFRESFNPADPAEEALVLRLAQAHWRSLRSRRIETAVYHVTANAQRNQARELVENCPEHLNPHEAIAVAFMAMPADHWQKYLRYDTTISRDFFKTLDALQKLQRTRQSRSPAESKPKVMHAGQPYAFAELSENGIGSVSQNSVLATEPPASASGRAHPGFEYRDSRKRVLSCNPLAQQALDMNPHGYRKEFFRPDQIGSQA